MAELKAWPRGLLERVKSAEQRIQDDRAPRSIPADPRDVDLVLAEVRMLIEGTWPPFWIKDAALPPTPQTASTEVDQGGALGDGAERRVEAVVEKLHRCKLGCGPFGQCKAAMHGVPSECAASPLPAHEASTAGVQGIDGGRDA